MLRDYANGRWEKWQKVPLHSTFVQCDFDELCFALHLLSIDPNRSERDCVTRQRRKRGEFRVCGGGGGSRNEQKK